jgi:surfeit locus 1 family protein
MWRAGLFGLLMIGVLCGLGIWQLQRLSFQQALLARMAERIHAPASALPDDTEWAHLSPDAYEYRHVKITGIFDHDKEALVFRSLAGTVGYLVLTPLRLSSGAYVIVNRGFVPSDKKSPSSRLEGETSGTVEVTGLMRSPEERNLFTPADSPQTGIWFTRDPLLIAKTFHLPTAAPFTVDAEAAGAANNLPQAGTTVLAIPNNHLSYALTWFGLAAALAAVLALFMFGRQAAN